MKFGRTYGTVRRMDNFDLNVIDPLFTLNRACEEVIKAEEFLTRKSGNEDDIVYRAVFSITDSKQNRGYYILVDDDVFIVAMGISTEQEPINYHMYNEKFMCESKNKTTPKDPDKKRTYEMFRLYENGELGQGILKALGIQNPGNYVISKNREVPVSISLRNSQIIFSL